jgi:hypothetical protein
VKTAFKGKGFQDDEDIKKKAMAELNTISLEAFALLYCHTLLYKLHEL